MHDRGSNLLPLDERVGPQPIDLLKCTYTYLARAETKFAESFLFLQEKKNPCLVFNTLALSFSLSFFLSFDPIGLNVGLIMLT